MDGHWPQILAVVEPARLDEVESSLFEAGALSVTTEDAGDSPILEPAPGTTPAWPATRVRALFPQGTALAPLLQGLAQRHASVEWRGDESLTDRAWEREWLRDYQPMTFGDRLLVRPTQWHDLACVEGQVELLLDPGLAFGTGTHPSTASCLQWLACEADLTGKRLLDYGCGSGILAVAGCLLGAERATCVDLDPQALIATDSNARINKVRERLAITPPGRLSALGYDVIVANILAGPLITLAPLLAALAGPGCQLKLAGILADQAGDVARAYAPWFEVSTAPIDDQWSRVSGRRHGGPDD